MIDDTLAILGAIRRRENVYEITLCKTFEHVHFDPLPLRYNPGMAFGKRVSMRTETVPIRKIALRREGYSLFATYAGRCSCGLVVAVPEIYVGDLIDARLRDEWERSRR